MACRSSFLIFFAALTASSCATSEPASAPPAATREVAPPEIAAPVAQTVPAPAPDTGTPVPVHFVVLHTNDIHGQVLPRKATWLKRENPPMVGGLARVAACIAKEKAAAEKEGAHVLVVDGGDWYTGTPEGVVDSGLPFVQALAGVGYDAVCIGNHEFDFGVPNLKNLLSGSKLPAVLANLDDRATGKRVDWVPPWRIVTKGQWKIAIVGFVATETPEITHPDAGALVFGDPAQALTKARAELGKTADWILPVTHIGVDDDRALARAHPDLPLIVGGHSHTFLKEGVREGTTLIVQTGAKASSVGRVDIWLDGRTRKAIESRARLIDLDEEPATGDCVAAVDGICGELAKKGADRMGEVVGELAGPLTRSKDPLGSSSAGNFLADALRKHAIADVGVMNRGGIRTDLDAGPVTRRHAFELCPFENNVTVLTLSGAELVDMITKSVEGTAHSGLEVSGVVVEAAIDAQGKRSLRGLSVGGVVVDPKKDYRVAMNSFLADGGDAYVEKVAPGPRRKDDPVLMRDLIEEVFRNKKVVTPNGENRYVVARTP